MIVNVSCAFTKTFPSFWLVTESSTCFGNVKKLIREGAKAVTYSVHPTFAKSDAWTLDDECAIDHGNESKCAVESRGHEVGVYSLERVGFHRL